MKPNWKRIAQIVICTLIIWRIAGLYAAIAALVVLGIITLVKRLKKTH